jgi:hypothetical protein
MKNYAYMIFFDHFITHLTSSIQTKTLTSRSVTPNFRGWLTERDWYYYPFHPYKAYVC